MEDKKKMNMNLLEFQYEQDIIKLLEDHGYSEIELHVYVLYDEDYLGDFMEVETDRIRICQSGERSWLEYMVDGDYPNWHSLSWAAWYDPLRILIDTYSELCLIF